MKRITFNLNSFLEDLSTAVVHRSDLIDDEVEKYKVFLSHTQLPLTASVIKYVNQHSLVSENEEVKSYIDACHKGFF